MKAQVLRSLLLAGVVPVVAFSVIEDRYGTLWGLVAGMVFGVGEIAYEAWTQRRVDPLTWGGNGLLLVLGGISLVTAEGIWFKLQPSLMEGAMALVLWGSVVWGKPLLVGLLQKQLAIQNPPPPGTPPPELLPAVAQGMRGITLRLGVFFALHAVLAAWAALAWSTAAWATLKGVGMTVSMVVYMVAEVILLRYRIAKQKGN